MINIHKTTTISALVMALVAGPALAQGTLIGTTDLNDRLDDIEEAVADDMERAEDAYRFGNPDMMEGFSGSASLSYTGKTGNNESQELTLGSRMRYASGPWVQTLGMAIDFTETSNNATKEDIFAVYDANYYFNDQFYAFALGRVKSDGLANTAADTKTDAFFGVGPGYRIINTEAAAWRVQAGLGVSYLKDGAGNSTTETGVIASSRAFYRISDTMFLSNDTDILKSDSALRINNDFGVSMKVSDTLSTRLSYLTDYNDRQAIRTDNKVGLSLVMGF